MRTDRQIDRAEEEIKTANREIRRLHTSIVDEEAEFKTILASLKQTDPLLYGATEEWCRRRRGDNARNMAFIQKTYELEGYTGERTPGRRLGAPAPSTSVPLESSQVIAASELELVSQELADPNVVQGSDEYGEEVTSMIEYLAGLTV